MEIIKKFNDSDAATTEMAKLVIKFLLSKNRDSIAKCHTNYGIQSDTLVAIFDIDDTIIFDVQKKGKKKKGVVPNKPLLQLMLRLHSLGLEIHLVTARLNQPEIVDITESELKNVNAVWHSLTLAPESVRTDMANVSRWKQETRHAIARQRETIVVVSVGDQWGDLLELSQDEDIDLLDHKYGNDLYIILRPHDGVSIWGLKLPTD